MRGNRLAGFSAILVLLAVAFALCACAVETPTATVEPPTPVRETVVVEKIVRETVEVTRVISPTPLPSDTTVTLNWNFGAEPANLDPALVSDTDVVSPDVVDSLFLGLTSVDETGKTKPALATTWTLNETGTIYTFRLRKDARWVSYNPAGGSVTEIGTVTAKDVVYGIKRALNPRTGARYAYVLYVIKGAEPLHKADPLKLTEEQIQKLVDGVSVRAIDDYTVEIMLERPAGYFPTLMAMWVARPAPKDVIEKNGARWVEPGFIVTNGPYLLADWYHGDHLTLVKNPKYYDADKVQIERINGLMIGDAGRALTLYRSNKLDGVNLASEDLEKLNKDAALSKEVRLSPHPCTYYYGFTHDKPPMDNKLVRRALSAAIDRTALTQTVLKGGEMPANAFVAPIVFGNVGGAKDVAPWALDPKEGAAKAKQWLAEAGYPNGIGFPTITLLYNNDRDAHKAIAEAVAEMWTSVLGIKVNLESQDWKAFLTTLSNKKTPADKLPHVWRMGWCAEYPDANNWLNEVFNPSLQQNYIRWNNKQYQELVEKAERSKDPDERLMLYKRAEQLLVDEEAAIAPLYFYSTASLTKPWLTRNYSELMGHDFANWKLDWKAKQTALEKS